MEGEELGYSDVESVLEYTECNGDGFKFDVELYTALETKDGTMEGEELR